MFKRLLRTRTVTKSRAVVLGAVMAFAVMTAGVTTLANPQSASAEACDQVNIVLCGLNGSGINGYINSFQEDYNSNSNNGHNDLKAVYRWAGATNESVSNMNANNTQIGTLYRNGDIKVDGKVVGHDAWVSARFNSGAGFQEISPGVWARKTTTSFAEPQAHVIVHFNNNGEADFAVMTGCGNAIKFTPVPPQQPSTLVCKNLKAEQIGNTRRYTFTARADATNSKITKYIFDFGDNSQNRVVDTSNNATAVAHTYDKDGKTYTARVTVKSNDGKSDTSRDCTATITTPTPAPTPALACVSLTQQQVTNQRLTYNFVATATASHTTITSYVFTFSDGKAVTIKTNKATASTTHAFTQNNTTYVTKVTVNSADVKNVTSPACKVSVTTPKVNECKPGVPVGSPACSTPTTPSTPPMTPAATTLPKTGLSAGALLGIFAGVTAFGAIMHRRISQKLNG